MRVWLNVTIFNFVQNALCKNISEQISDHFVVL
jgi:hypothetical protein